METVIHEIGHQTLELILVLRAEQMAGARTLAKPAETFGIKIRRRGIACNGPAGRSRSSGPAGATGPKAK